MSTQTQFSAIDLDGHQQQHNNAEPSIAPPSPSIPDDFQAIAYRVYTALKPMLEKDPYLAPLLATAYWNISLRPAFPARFGKLRAVIARPKLQLKPRERQILELIASGMRDVEISHTIEASSSLVHHYRKELLRKFHCTTSSQLIRQAQKQGLVPPRIYTPVKPWKHFTPRQRHILQALKENPNLDNAEIAAMLGISPEAVKTHLQGIRIKLELGPGVPKWRLPQLVGGDE